MPSPRNPQTIFHAFLYGGGSALLALDLFFLVRALIAGSFIPVLPIIAATLLTAGLLLVLFAEHQARERDKREHRRLSRVATQLERPLIGLREDLEGLIARAEKLPSEERMKLKHMETRTNTLLNNVRDVFLTMRAQEGLVADDMRAYDLCTLVSEAVEDVGDLAKAKNVEIMQKAHCKDAPVEVDRRLVLIALRHLLENGIHYTITPGILNVAIVRGKGHVRVVVQDRGIGIKQKDRDVVFKPFARGDKASQYDEHGIGVGLTLSRLIIEEMGGTLTWRPRKNSAGSEFEMQVPLVRK